MKLKSNIKKFYVYSFFHSLIIHVPVFILYWKQYLTLTEVMIMHVAFFGLGILLEIPSGVFADLYGRKISIFVGRFFYLLAIVGFIIAPKLGGLWGFYFLWFFLAECLAGVSKAFDSGADTAFIYDTLKKQRKQEQFKKIRGRIFSVSLIALALAAFFGSLIARYGLEKPYYFTVFFIFIALIAILTFKEPTHYKKLGMKHYWQHQKECLIFTLTHKRVRWLSFYYGLMFALSFIGVAIFFQLYLEYIGVPLRDFSIIYPSLLIFGAMVSFKAHQIEEWLGEKLTLYSLPILLALSFILMAVFDFYLAFLLLFIIEGIHVFITPVLDHYVHEHVVSKQRATVLSIRNLFAGVIFTIFSPFIGWMGDLFSLSAAFLTSGLVVFVLGIVIMLFWRKNIGIADS